MIGKFLKQCENGDRPKELPVRLEREREQSIVELQEEVFAFEDWPGVLRAPGLQEE
jgi:hypothetical protein